VEVDCYDLMGGEQDLVCYELKSLIDKGSDIVARLDAQPLVLYDNIIEGYYDYEYSDKTIEKVNVDLGEFGSNLKLTRFKSWSFENGYEVSLLLSTDSHIEYLVMGFKK
jgi:hypothetical protein